MTATSPRLVHDPEGLNTAVWPIEADQLITPIDRFFTRSHAPAPNINPTTWHLEIDGLVDRPRSFSLEELVDAFPRREVVATLVCAGLRRDEFLGLGPMAGELPWGPEAISTGRWSGIGLADVLREVGVQDSARHVEFIGLDRVERQANQFGFGGSVELSKALSEEVLLATELNGSPLPAAHGYPLRAVVPGWIGARSVKWLGRITLRSDPSPNYFQSQAYRFQRERNPHEPRDVSGGVALTGVPLNAVILTPTAEQVVPAGRVRVRGWAIGSGGSPLTSIELSSNSGVDWTRAVIGAGGERWTWTLWEAAVELKPGSYSLVVRATDSSGATQPAHVNATWNVKGYNNNAWHRVTIRAE
jgi:sulfite oxidase